MKQLGSVLSALMLSACAPSLAGRLTSETGEPVATADARVNVSSLAAEDDVAAPLPLVLPVDGAGEFAAGEKLPPGEYLVEALVPGYSIASKKITVGKGEDARVVLALTPIDAAKTRATSANLEAPQGRGAGGATLTPPSF